MYVAVLLPDHTVLPSAIDTPCIVINHDKNAKKKHLPNVTHVYGGIMHYMQNFVVICQFIAYANSALAVSFSVTIEIIH